MSSETRLLTVDQLQEVIPLTAATIRKHAKQGVLPAVKIGGRWFFRKKDIEELIGGKDEFTQDDEEGTLDQSRLTTESS